jgi:hypothetical protein
MATKIVDVTHGKDGKKLELPPSHKVVHIEYTDPDSGMIYGGEFTIKRLNIGDLRKAAINRTQLNGGVKEELLDENVKFMNMMMSHLSVAIVKAPDWWKPEEFYNGRVIFEVYEEVARFEDSFRSAVRSGAPAAPADSTPAA